MNLPVPDPAFRWSAEPWGHALRCRALDPVAQHAFTTRQLQLRDPRQEAIAWTQAVASLGAGLEQLLRIKQVHGRSVRVLRRGEIRPADVAARPEADAIVCNEPHRVLAVQTADCVPILLADRTSGAAAAIHAGWRGTAANVVEATLATLVREFGTRAADLTVAVGPSIAACCYEVGPELIDAFRHNGVSEAAIGRWFARNGSGSLRLDLWSAIVDQLETAGVRRDQIHVARLCTRTYAETFDSYRADGVNAGRMAALVRVPE